MMFFVLSVFPINLVYTLTLQQKHEDNFDAYIISVLWVWEI